MNYSIGLSDPDANLESRVNTYGHNKCMTLLGRRARCHVYVPSHNVAKFPMARYQETCRVRNPRVMSQSLSTAEIITIDNLRVGL